MYYLYIPPPVSPAILNHTAHIFMAFIADFDSIYICSLRLNVLFPIDIYGFTSSQGKFIFHITLQLHLRRIDKKVEL